MQNVVKTGDIRVGVLGAFRGESFARTAANSGMKLVAVCDNFEVRLREVTERLGGVKGYADFDDFIRHDMDAVVIAAPFHLHAGFAMKALDHGKHVLSETSCNITLAEGVELYQKAEQTGLCYMLAENYCYTRFNQEMKKLYDAGEIGIVRYAEGEYNHPMEINDSMWYSPGVKHWRNQLPSCYYNTHALAPMMHITGAHPVEVSCVSVPVPDSVEGVKRYKMLGGAYVMLIRMDNNAIFRIMGGFAGHSCWYGFHGTVGAMESGRGHGYFGPETVRVWHEPWDLKPGQVEEKEYFPNWPSHSREANQTGHGGGDFFVELTFAQSIRTGVQPYLNAYNGVTMSNVGILAWRSAHQNGQFVKIPDLKTADGRAQMLADRLCPFEGVPNSELMPPEMRCPVVFTPELQKIARINWKRHGYTDDEIEELLNQ